MGRNQPEFDRERWETTTRQAERISPLAKSLLPQFFAGYFAVNSDDLYRETANAASLEEFWSNSLRSAVEAVTDREYAAVVRRVLELRQEEKILCSLTVCWQEVLP